MSASMVDIQFATAEIRRRKKERRRRKKQDKNIYKNESKHSEMGPLTQKPIHRTVRSVHVCVQCTTVADNIAQNRLDSFPPYAPDNHHCSDDVYLREGGSEVWEQTTVVCTVQQRYQKANNKCRGVKSALEYSEMYKCGIYRQSCKKTRHSLLQFGTGH